MNGLSKDSAIIKLQKVSKTIRKKTLLHPLTYEVKRGNILALCGGNGAGKSTLIRLITGLLKPTSGQIKFNITPDDKSKKAVVHRMGYMPDNFNFQPNLTAKEIIRFYAAIKGVAKQAYEQVLKDVGLLEKQDVKVGTFSKGMAQRLLFAQALLAQPPLLILDEPTNGLDPYWNEQFCQTLLAAKQKEQTVIFSTHDLYIAEKVADGVIFMHDGQVISQFNMADNSESNLNELYRDAYFKKVKNSR